MTFLIWDAEVGGVAFIARPAEVVRCMAMDDLSWESAMLLANGMNGMGSKMLTICKV